jgi:hypothetical protein
MCAKSAIERPFLNMNLDELFEVGGSNNNDFSERLPNAKVAILAWFR